MFRQVKLLLAIGLVIGLVVASAPEAGAKFIKTKINWDVGQLKVPGATHDLVYEDAHLKVTTEGRFEDGGDPDRPPAPDVEDGAFGSSTVGIDHKPLGQPDEMTIDWQATPGHAVAGRTHIGAEVYVSDLGNWTTPVDVTLKVVGHSLTNVTCPGLGGTSTPEMDMPKPTIKYYPGSIHWEFAIDNPWLTSSVTFSNINFYKTSTEPALSDLTAVNFPPLPKTFLQSEPSFSLVYPQFHPILIAGADEWDWLLAEYTTRWVDPWWTTQVGMPVTVEVNTWVAVTTLPQRLRRATSTKRL